MAEVVEQRRRRELDRLGYLRGGGNREQRRELDVGRWQVVGEGQRVEAQVLGAAGKGEELGAGAAAAGGGESGRGPDHGFCGSSGGYWGGARAGPAAKQGVNGQGAGLLM